MASSELKVRMEELKEVVRINTSKLNELDNSLAQLSTTLSNLQTSIDNLKAEVVHAATVMSKTRTR